MDEELKKSILKTGTTILGIVCKDGVVMASDRQVSLGHSVVGKKNFVKTRQLNDYILMSIAGQASDGQRLWKVIPAELKLKELRSKSRPSVKQAANLLASISFSNIRQPSMIPSIVGSLLGGFNEDGSVELYTIGIDGSIDIVDDYDASVGSGMQYVYGLLERQYKKDLTIKEAIELAQEALKSSTQRDVGSGYGIDVFTITKEGIKKEVEQTIEPGYKDDK
ncbi:proteasome subunit beta [Candidatus Pacearchaeota archaeon]|nr:proteasome subunit beta [Candidatus Pacearchaeota archaeon]|tara:strand:+ start:2032 stop:2697 length:666 start_codon:yes stop_codon:yes gene_type:complete